MYEFLNQEIAIVKKIMLDRARTYDVMFIVEDVYELDAKGPVIKYDQEDAENHQYDLGRLKTLEEVKQFYAKEYGQKDNH